MFQVSPGAGRTLRLAGDLDMATVPILHAALQLLRGGRFHHARSCGAFVSRQLRPERVCTLRAIAQRARPVDPGERARPHLIPPRDGRLRQAGHRRDPMMTEPHDAPVISLAERLKSRREQLGLSQAQAARELDVARTAYRLWEMEAAKPQPDRWRLISRGWGLGDDDAAGRRPRRRPGNRCGVGGLRACRKLLGRQAPRPP